MPSSIDFMPLAQKLLQRTGDGKVAWKGTYESTTFICVLEGEFTFTIDLVRRGTAMARRLTMKDKEDGMVFELSAAEPNEMTSGENDTLWNFLGELWQSARRAALDIDNKINKATNLLDNL